MSETLTKSMVLEQIAREETFWQELLGEVGYDHMLEPGVTGDWTFKDVIAHLNGWLLKRLAYLDAAQHEHAPVPPPWPADLNEHDDNDIDQINAWIEQASRDRSLQSVLDEHEDSFRHMRAAVLALSDRDLFEPGRYPWLDGEALAPVITESFEHLHDEHVPVLRAWLDQRTQADS